MGYGCPPSLLHATTLERGRDPDHHREPRDARVPFAAHTRRQYLRTEIRPVQQLPPMGLPLASDPRARPRADQRHGRRPRAHVVRRRVVHEDTLLDAADRSHLWHRLGQGQPVERRAVVVIAGTTQVYVVDMDPQPPSAPYPNHRIGPPRDVSDCGLTDCTIDSARISASGKYGVVFYTGDDIRVFDVDPATLALTPHAMPTSSYRCAGTAAAGYIYSLGHADVALNPFDNDEDVIVGQDERHLSGQTVTGVLIGHVLMVRLRDDAIVALTDPSNEAYADHISTRNLNRPGWAYVDYFQEDGMRFSDEVIAVKLDGGKAVQT